MPIVSNTSPLLNLAIIDQLGLLRAQFGAVIIPSAVRTELRPESDFPGAGRLRTALADGWISVMTLETLNVARALQRDLDDGEAEAIALALQRGDKGILMDEHDGRVVAKAMGLTPTGVLGVVLRAKQTGALVSVQETIHSLQREAGFRIAPSLIDILLQEAGEKS